VFELAKDILAVIGLLWILGTIFFAISDEVKGRSED
jgi:hypothetical protein